LSPVPDWFALKAEKARFWLYPVGPLIEEIHAGASNLPDTTSLLGV